MSLLTIWSFDTEPIEVILAQDFRFVGVPAVSPIFTKSSLVIGTISGFDPGVSVQILAILILTIPLLVVLADRHLGEVTGVEELTILSLFTQIP